jgi:hypothetical protein
MSSHQLQTIPIT